MTNRMCAAVLGIAIAAMSAIVNAHVTVAPRQSPAGATERYTVRVPTEGQVATTSVELEIPPEVTVTEVVPGAEYTFETRRAGGRIVAITWTQDIPPKARGEFVFVARNPARGTIVWKAHQRFADGTTADWVGPEGDRRPASVTSVSPLTR